ncbi:MAG: phosphoenolpyruvate--protein phosphotransferase [Solirubrobacteraceae bacterium]
MVGIVVVSHSARVAEGVVELAREMGGEDARIEPAGGMAEPAGAIGTDAELVKGAIERASGDDGVLVLMDLGSALMTAEMAVELSDDATRVVLSEAPLVEGAIAAAATARGGATLDEVAAEARGALGPKAAQLGVEPATEPAVAPGDEGEDQEDGETVRLRVENRLGLHARPAARLVATARRFEAEVSLVNETTGAGPANAGSLTGVATLGVRQGHEILVRARGPDATPALEAIAELARDGFGDEDGAAPAEPAQDASPAQTAQDASPAPAPTAAPPEPGARLAGLAAAPGIALGPVRHLQPPALEVPAHPTGEPAEEWRSLDDARDAARRDIEADHTRVRRGAGAAEASIFDAHLALLDDSALLDPARRSVFDERASAAGAWREAAEAAARAFEATDDAYLRARAADVRDVAGRVLGHLLGGGTAPAPEGAGIVVAAELTPGQTAGLDRAVISGIATARGSATSHAAILARSFGIPAVVGLGDAVLALDEGTPLLLDGTEGAVVVDPPEEVRAEFQARQAKAEARRHAAVARAGEPAVTRDGVGVEVAANIAGPDDVPAALEHGADGVGLLRTEFLFLDRERLPDEDEQFAAYSEIAAALDGRPLVVRTLDVGADKPLPSLPQPPEDNPFLGRRGIRLALDEPEVLRVQLRAIVRTAAEHPGVKLMFPMVTTLEEYRTARALLDEVRRELDTDGRLEVGIMVEVPAAALAADRFAPEVDFFSLGTNDLAQYTMAAERGNEHVAALADGPVPALLRLVAGVARAARAHGRWVGACGELAGDPAAAVLLVGLGVRELSMAPARIPEVKELVRGLEAEAAEAAAGAALDRDSAGAARADAAPLMGF